MREMNIDEQLENFLAGLGVEMEYNSQESQHNDDASIPEVSIFQASRDHYGVFYRLAGEDGDVSCTHKFAPAA